jgi:hypothetical protein
MKQYGCDRDLRGFLKRILGQAEEITLRVEVSTRNASPNPIEPL